MPAIAATDAIATNSAAGRSSKANSMNSLASEDFYRLLITELQNQDPLEPTKTADMVNQVSQIRSIEQSNQLNRSLTELSQAQRGAASSELLGKFVSASVVDANGKTIEVRGVVSGIRFDTDGTTLLDLDSGQTIRAEDIETVTTPESLFDPLGLLSSSSSNTESTADPNETKTESNASSRKPAPQSPLRRLLTLGGLLGS